MGLRDSARDAKMRLQDRLQNNVPNEASTTYVPDRDVRPRVDDAWETDSPPREDEGPADIETVS